MEENKNINPEQDVQSIEPQAPAPQPAPEQVAPQPQKGKPKKKSMSFGKVFLAALLAVVAGSVVTFVFWVVLFSGISAAFQTETTEIPESAILKINLAESIIDAPSKNPMASFDFNTMQPAEQVTLFKALQAIEAAKNVDRI